MVSRVQRFVSASTSDKIKMMSRQRRKVQWTLLHRRKREFALAHGKETYLVRLGDAEIGWKLYFLGEYDIHSLVMARELLGRHQFGTVVDVGANIGSICIPAVSRRFAQRSIAIEPEPMNFALLQVNVAMNGLSDRINCMQIALGPESNGTAILRLDESNFGNHRVDSGGPDATSTEAINVPLRRLDDIAPRLDPATDVIFMDVQGFEGQVLKGSTTATGARVPIVMEFTPSALRTFGGLSVVVDALANYDQFYDLHLSAPTGRPISELPDLASQYEQHASGYTDILVC